MDLAAQLAQEEAGPNAPRPAPSLGDGTIPHPAQLLPDLAEIDYNVDLDEDERVKLAHRLVREFQHYREFTAARREFALEYRKAARMMPDEPADADGADGWRATVRAPNTREACQNHTTKLDGQILKQKPLFTVEVEDEAQAEKGPMIEEALDASLEQAQFHAIARLVHRHLPQVSPLLVRTQWVRQVSRMPRHRLANFDEQAFHALGEAGADPRLAYLAAAEQHKSGPEKGRIKVEFGFADVVTKDGNDLAVIPFEDIVLFPPSAKTEEELWGIGERLTMVGMDLKEAAAEGRFDADAVEELLQRRSDEFNEDRQNFQDMAGLGGTASATAQDDDALYREYELIELDYRGDLDGDGKLEWYIVTVELRHQRLLRCQYNPYWHGKPRYKLFAYIGEAGDLFGMSIAELVSVLQEELSHARNRFSDLLWMLANAGSSILYTESCGLDPDQFTLDPGTLIPCTDVTGIKQFPLAEGTPAALQYILKFLEFGKDDVDRLTATSNPTLGKETDGQRTLGEIQIDMGQAAAIFENYADGVSLNWVSVVERIKSNQAQFSEDGQVRFSRPATPGRYVEEPPGSGQQVPAASVGGEMRPAPKGRYYGSVPAADMAAEVRIVPAGLGQFADRQSRFQRSQMVLTTLLQHPLTAQLPEVQQITLEQWLDDLSYPKREAILALVTQMLQAQAQQQAQAQAQLQALMATLPADQQLALMTGQGGAPGAAGGAPGAPGGAPGGGQNPMQQLSQVLNLVTKSQTVALNDAKLGAGKKVPEGDLQQQTSQGQDLVQRLLGAAGQAAPAGPR